MRGISQTMFYVGRWRLGFREKAKGRDIIIFADNPALRGVAILLQCSIAKTISVSTEELGS